MQENELDHSPHYQSLRNLLVAFLVATYEHIVDDAVIIEYVDKCSAEDIRATLKQGREFLALDPFPWKWVYGLVEYRTLEYVKDVTHYEKYYSWVNWMMSALELEAKKQGKL